MFTKITLAVVLGATSLLALTAEGSARSKHRMAIYDANTGKTLYDDGKLDGKACAVGTRAVYNPVTGKFTKVPAAKCNF